MTIIAARAALIGLILTEASAISREIYANTALLLRSRRQPCRYLVENSFAVAFHAHQEPYGSIGFLASRRFCECGNHCRWQKLTGQALLRAVIVEASEQRGRLDDAGYRIYADTGASLSIYGEIQVNEKSDSDPLFLSCDKAASFPAPKCQLIAKLAQGVVVDIQVDRDSAGLVLHEMIFSRDYIAQTLA